MQNLSWESQKRVKTEVLARKSQKSEFLKAKIVPLLDRQRKCSIKLLLNHTLNDHLIVTRVIQAHLGLSQLKD